MNRTRTTLVGASILLAAGCASDSNEDRSTGAEPAATATTSAPLDGVATLIGAPMRYLLDIEGTALGAVTDARQGGDELLVDYAYTAANGDDRAGTITLTIDGDAATGTYRTLGSNGAIFEGTAELTFRTDGTATGTHTFGATTLGLDILLEP